MKYTEEHEWLRIEDDLVVVGITDHASAQLGDVVFVELPDLGDIDKGSPIGVVESGRANSDIYAPIAGEIIEINTDLVVDPAKINIDPYDTGWIFKIRVNHPDQVNDLMDAASYSGLIS